MVIHDPLHWAASSYGKPVEGAQQSGGVQVGQLDFELFAEIK